MLGMLRTALLPHHLVKSCRRTQISIGSHRFSATVFRFYCPSKDETQMRNWYRQTRLVTTGMTSRQLQVNEQICYAINILATMGKSLYTQRAIDCY